MKNNRFGSVVLLNRDAIQLNLVRDMLSEYPNTSCICFQSVQAALSYLHTAFRVDVVVVDYFGIEIDMFEFIKAARAARPGKWRMIVAGPGHYSEDIRVRLLSTGADYYMIKPYKADALRDCIDMMKAGRRLAWNTPWDGRILRELDARGVPQEDAGYWYLASSVQGWLMCSDLSPQLKSICYDVGKYYDNLRPKSVESGIHRALAVMAKRRGLARVPSNKDMIVSVAKSIWLESEQEGQGREYATET